MTAVDARAEPIEDTLEMNNASANTYPLTWELTDLRTAASFLKAGGTPPTGNADYYNGDIPFVKVEDVVNAGMYLRKTGTFISLEGLNNSAAWIVEPETLLYTMYASYGVPTITKIGAATNQAIIAISFNSSYVINEFAVHYLWYIKPSLAKVVKGSTQPNLNAGIVSSLPFPLPPLEEQRRIVIKLEALFSKLEAGVTALQRARALLKRYRQCLLRDAVEGELSADWRAKQPDLLEPATVLLERVLRERREAWEARELAKLRAKGLEPLGDAWKARYEPPSGVDSSSLPELPDSWVWANVELLAASGKGAITDGPFGSNLKTEHYKDAGARVIRLQNIGDGQFFDAEAFITPEHFATLRKHSVAAGDILIAALGETVPRACLAPVGLGDTIVKADCIRFRVSELVSASFLMSQLNSFSVQHRASAIVHGVGRPRLNLGEIKALVLALPPLEEQLFIVAELERRFELLGALESTLESALKRAAQLRQSALHRAFTGRLVPQNPRDEPAAALLERIRAARLAAPQGRGARVAKPEGLPDPQKAARGRPRKAQKQEELF